MAHKSTPGLRPLLRSSLLSLTYNSGACSLARTGARILCFHGVSENPQSYYAVCATDFLEQMNFLATNYQVISIERLVALLQNGDPAVVGKVGLTFDDGYQDFYTHAYPVLKKFALPATVFLPTGLVDGCLERLHKLPQNDFLAWDQIRELRREGVCFGSHTVSHPSLARLAGPNIQNELEASKFRIETELGEKVSGLAYPYGTFRDISPALEKITAAVGYNWAVSSISGVNRADTNLFALRRTVITTDDGLVGFKRILRGALDGWIVIQKTSYYLEMIKRMTRNPI